VSREPLVDVLNDVPEAVNSVANTLLRVAEQFREGGKPEGFSCAGPWPGDPKLGT